MLDDIIKNIKEKFAKGKQLEAQKVNKTIEIMKSGNEDFASGESTSPKIDKSRVEELAVNGQKPYAVVVACSDSRATPEHLFNAGLGELFVIRTAGNVIGDIELGSIEYAVEHLHIDTVIVLGHEKCGAVDSAIGAAIATHTGELGNVKFILDIVTKSVEKAKSESSNISEIVSKTENYNIIEGVETIKSSKLMADLIKNGKLTVVGAKYSIYTGKVTFFES